MQVKSEHHIKAANERWYPSTPKATHTGILSIAGQDIECDVLEDGRRILRKKTFLKSMGRTVRPSKNVIERSIQSNVPVFVSANNLTPYLKPEFTNGALEINYRSVCGKRQKGYEAKILPETCEIYLKARQDGVLVKKQEHLALACEIMMRAFAKVGLIALIDEVTCYQEARERNELEKILEKYISEELRAWTKKFPNEFFKQVYRLHGWEYPKKTNHPQYVGKIINKYVYDKLPPGVKGELERKNPSDNGIRKYRHHQFLSENIGDENLENQILRVITVMKLSDNVEEFKKMMDKL